MRIPRFHQPGPLAAGQRLRLSETAFRHAVRVLRLKLDDALVLFDGRGGEYPARLVELDKREAWVELGAHVAREAESPLAMVLVQGVSKGERMDYTLQKAVELGVAEIRPVFSARAVVALAGERLERKLEHWRGVVASACEQSGRNRVPEVHAPVELATWLAQPVDRGLVLDPGAGCGLRGIAVPAGRIALLIGPEGGWSGAELTAAFGAGYIGVRLGPRVMRTETAGVAALAALQALWGDLG